MRQYDVFSINTIRITSKSDISFLVPYAGSRGIYHVAINRNHCHAILWESLSHWHEFCYISSIACFISITFYKKVVNVKKTMMYRKYSNLGYVLIMAIVLITVINVSLVKAEKAIESNVDSLHSDTIMPHDESKDNESIEDSAEGAEVSYIEIITAIEDVGFTVVTEE
jgi:hypothetical protein